MVYCPWSNSTDRTYDVNSGSYIPNSSGCFGGNGLNGSSVFHSKHGPEYTGNLSFQWRNSTDRNVVHKPNARLGRRPKNRKVEEVNGPQNPNGGLLFKTDPNLVVPNGNVINDTST
ncbi:hypothetical protein Hdeb2414_s0023g00627441 [Helianthus debilis subsp. tardiflorus]